MDDRCKSGERRLSGTLLELTPARNDLSAAARAAFRLTAKEMIREIGDIAVPAKPSIPILAFIIRFICLKTDAFV
jgi:hypothetical protein